MRARRDPAKERPLARALLTGIIAIAGGSDDWCVIESPMGLIDSPARGLVERAACAGAPEIRD